MPRSHTNNSRRTFGTRFVSVAAAAFSALGACVPAHAEKLHFTFLWHMEQPVYWPDQQVSGADRYETAWESIQRRDASRPNPTNNLRDIFGLPDRVAGYQYRMRDCVNAIRWTDQGGAQISYSGGLIENIQSLGNANQLGYSPNWSGSLREARAWTTTNGPAKPRADIVIFPFHHALMPLLEPSTMRKEIQLYKEIYADAWGSSVPRSRGFFPSEMAFSSRMIPVLQSEGIDWSIVSAEKLSRACADFPVVFGSGGVNCDPPNKSDQLNPAQGASAYYRSSISRGCAPVEAFPFAQTPRRAQYIDPQTGIASSIVVVPSAQSLSWRDGYSAQGIEDFDTLNTRNNANRPMLVVLAHDGDNAWGGGYTYYMEATPNRVSQASAAGYTASTVERYLADHPVPANDLVHVEDGAWVNADSDFGSPQFWNWNWPLLNSSGQIDIENGWHEDARNWAVITAAQNAVDTAEQMHTAAGGTVNTRRILYPDATTNRVERAWHYFLGALNSGYMYYGTAEDFEVKPTIACNEALEHANVILNAAPTSGPTSDTTGPTIWIPQRWPWNPGTVNFGGPYGYRQTINNGDFYIWTFVHDVSGTQSVTLKYRTDVDGQIPLNGTQNHTYAGGPEVGAWQSLPMTTRVFPAGNVYNNPSINFFEMPAAIASQRWAKVIGIRSQMLDYYIEAVDAKGNIRKSPIQHVWIGDGSGATTGGGGTVVTLTPEPAVAGQSAQFAYNASGRVLASATTVKAHIGFNNWSFVQPSDLALTFNSTTSKWEGTVSVPTNATQIDIAFNNGAGVWDNNGGADWHFAVTGTITPPPTTGSCCVGNSCTLTTQAGCTGTFSAGGACTASTCQPTPPSTWVMDGALDTGAILVASNNALWLRAGLIGDTLYVAGPDAGEGNDIFIFLARAAGALRASPWAKAGQVAAWEAFLADENDGTYSGWADHGAGVTVASATGPNGGALEGTINLRQKFNLAAGVPLPDSIQLALAQYPTANGASLLSALQVPASQNGNTTIDPGEFITVRLCQFSAQGCCPADFDRSNSITADDIFAFLDAWFDQNSQSGPGRSADIDNSNTVNADDIFAFLDHWFANC